MIRIAINGFGRIGKTFLRVLFQDPKNLEKISVVAINVGPADPSTIAYMLKYDSVMHTFSKDVEYKNSKLYIDGKEIAVIAECDPKKLPWKKFGIDWVVESSGAFTKREAAEQHIKAGAKKVLITAPSTDEDVTIIPGVNNDMYNHKKHTIVSLGSCTTNAFVPMLKVIDDAFKIKNVFITTTHAYTNSQALLDVNASSKDMRRSRAAALNIVPSTTGATKVVGKVLPHLGDKVFGGALRVPVPTVSLLDLVFLTEKKFDQKSINSAFTKASQKNLKNIVAVSEEPLVSSDYIGNPHSVTLDSLLTSCNGPLGKISGWYDNEWGYSSRLKDFLLMIGKN